MKRFLLSMILIVAVTAIQAAKPTTSLKVYATKKQHITGFGGACCDGAMKPFGDDWIEHHAYGDFAEFYW